MIDRRDVLLAATLAAAVCLVYLAALDVGFYSDDYEWLGRMNPTLERPSYMFSIFYRDFNPVLHASFLIDWITGGGSALAYHAHSLVVHGLCAGLLLLLCKRMTGNRGLALAVALTWALNVRISETVIWPAARGHSLATLLVLAALLAAGSRGRWREVTAVVLFVLALLTKEIALLPLLLVPLFVSEPRRDLRLFGVLGGLAVIFVLFNVAFKPDLHTSAAGPATLLLKTPFILLRPLGLGDYYDFGWPSFAVVLLVFFGLAFLLRRTVALTGFAWVAACTLPIVPLDKLSSRYLYLMSVGYALILCGAAPWIGGQIRNLSLRRLATWAALAGVLVVAVANVVRIQDEIGDYEILARPYAACVEALAPPLRSLAAGETVVVVEVGPGETIPELANEIRQRGNINKLIPYRAGAVAGLIELPDLLNMLRREPGRLGHGVNAAPASPHRLVLYDGSAARVVDTTPGRRGVTSNRLAARWGDAADYFGNRHP